MVAGALALLMVLGAAVSTAHAQSTTTVTATWDRNGGGDTSGYVVQYGTAPGNYQWSYDAGNQVSAQLSLTSGATYYFAVRAYNASAQMGPPSAEASVNLGTVAAPTASITATLQNATTALVTWSTTNATSAVINGAAVGLSGSTTVPVSATTTFTIVATGASGATATQSATVTVTTAPVTPTATISASLQSATSALVTWSTTNATSAVINGVAVGLSGSTAVAITGTTTFTIVATSSTGATVTRSATVTVTAPAAPTATISATLQGSNALVTWSTTNATTARINGAAVALSGSTTVPVSATTTFTLVATNAGGATATRSATVTVATAGNGAPTANITGSLQSGKAVLTWTTTNAVKAEINGSAVALTGTTAIPMTATTTFRLLATAANGAMMDHSVTISAATATGAPGAPTSMAATANGTRVTFSWAPPATGPRPDRYLIDVGLSGSTAMIVSGYSVGNVTAIAADLPKGNYNARIRAANAYGVSGYSSLVTVKVGRKLNSPRSFSVQWSGRTATLSWTAPAADGGLEDVPTAYVLEAGTRPGSTDVVSVNLGNVTRFSTPIPSGTYYVRLRAENAYGDSDPTADIALAAPGAPAAPTTLVATRSATVVAMRWNAPSGPAPTGYILEAGSAPGLADLAVVQLGAATTFSTAAPPAGTYYLRVRAINGNGAGPTSNEFVLR